MKRYQITQELKEAIRNSQYSMRKLSKILGFEIKNIYYYNHTIREDHLQKLKFLLNLDFELKEAVINYEKNLGIHAVSPPPKLIKENGDLAEFIGIMLGDGNIWKNQLRISFDRRNKIYIKHVKRLVKKIFNIDLKINFLKNSNTCHLYYYNKILIEQLINFGLKRGHKIKNQVRIPDWIKQNLDYSKKCMKGLIDTDGCVFICKREKQKYVNFTNHNQKLLNDFKELTKSLGYSFAKSNITNTRLYRKDEVVRFIKEIKPFKNNGVVG